MTQSVSQAEADSSAQTLKHSKARLAILNGQVTHIEEMLEQVQSDASDTQEKVFGFVVVLSVPRVAVPSVCSICSRPAWRFRQQLREPTPPKKPTHTHAQWLLGKPSRNSALGTSTGVVWCGVPKALLPKGKRPGCLPTGTGKRAGLCVLCARRA